MTTTAAPPTTSTRRAPLYFHVAAWAVPVLLLTEFAMIALVPVLVVLIGSFTDARVHFARWWATAVAALYAIPLAVLNLRDDPAPSLSKDMHPAFLTLIVLAAVALLVRLYWKGRR
ncbi:hypothetical protein CLV46_2555 [Diaminobutyricimonas aerilata]|uniref:Uncharacterized protein n=1 Tax=Diaminobutyricimonas aerilata TaxID=1162967 RepID=A0A2M9CM48_9MICO|nr:hypothetical protein [Diaminobutyricimonas aerilata]PJJ72975.1 hypothetical protein CLV46_2555 [Diaminobutyricimonas aerilata]